MLGSPLFAVVAAVLVWFVSTGAILLTIRQISSTGGASARLSPVIWGIPFLIFGCVGAGLSLEDTSVQGVYLGFVSALAIWGWFELAFLAGVITGPNKSPLPHGARGGLRFVHAIGALAYNIAALTAVLLGLYAVSVNASNQIAFGVCGILFLVRLMANLNLFFGVPGINVEAVPAHMEYLKTYFLRQEPSWFFPLSIIVLCGLTGLFVERLFEAGEPRLIITSALLASLCGLALLEHCMMLIPQADAKLWRWMVPRTMKLSRHLGPSSPYRNETSI